MMQHYYIAVHTAEGEDGKEAVKSALRSAGVTVEKIEETAQEFNGVIHTEGALEEIWWVESGAEYCDSPLVKGKPTHREWGELTDEQQEHFTAKLTDWMGDQRYKEFYLSEHDGEDVFDGVAIECRQHEPPRPWESKQDDAKAK